MRRWLTLIGLVVGAIIASKLLLENVLGFDLEAMAAAWMNDAGAGSALTVVLLLGIDLFLPVPSSLVMVLSGAAFGVVWGSLLSLVGSVGGEWVGFELARRYGRGASRWVVDEAEMLKLERQFVRYGAAAVAVTRALPVVMETMSIVAGLSRMKRSTFLLASIVGTAPVVVIYAYAGAVSRQVGSMVPAVVILIAVAGAAWIWHRSRKDRLVVPSVSRTGAKG
jgi:uncharacterized membrane protein YdjX (TVP38/TMEM64 family)